MLSLLAFLLAQGPTVTAMDPVPGSVGKRPNTVTLTLSAAPDPATITSSTVKLVGTGPDATFDTGDDTIVTPASITVVGNDIVLDLTGSALFAETHRVTLSGVLVAPAPVSGRFAHWPMNEGAGATTADSSGNGRTGTLTGATWATGLFGNALQFNAAATRVDIDAGSVAPGWTVAMWVYRSGDVPAASAALMDCSALSNGTSLRLEQSLAGDQVGLTEYTVTDYGTGYVLPLDQWTHLAFTSDSLNARLHVDGVLQNTAPRAFNLHVDKLGSATTARTDSLIGRLDEVQVYSRVLTDGEIAGLATLDGAVRSGGEMLDGEFAGTFPSGNGVSGGTFTASFTIETVVIEVDGCGLLGGELLLPALLLLAWRRRRR